MSDLINRDEVCLNCMIETGGKGCWPCLVKDAPTVDAVEVVHGHWIKPTVIDGRAFNIPHCSICNGVPCGVDEHTNYCPNCGAKMDEVNE